MPKKQILPSLLIEHRLVTDRQTDRQGHGVIASKRASSVARIKIGRNQANCVCNNLTSVNCVSWVGIINSVLATFLDIAYVFAFYRISGIGLCCFV